MLATSMTWVRAPGLYYFQYYFAIYVHVQAQQCGSPYTFIIQRPRVLGDQIKGMDLKNTLHPGPRSSMLLKKVKRTQIIGPDYSKLHLHFGDYYPPWFAILYVFLMFYFQLLFCFLYCFALINYFYKI